MNFFRVCTVSVMIIAAFALSGCGGGGADVRAETTAESSGQTLGQELIDLKKAYDMGIISEREYNEARERIIEKRTTTDR